MLVSFVGMLSLSLVGLDFSYYLEVTGGVEVLKVINWSRRRRNGDWGKKRET